jgi:hypothetical protein
VYNKRKQRLDEIQADNILKLQAPFDYQTRLLQDEENDILLARTNAIRDANDAYDDLVFRLESFAEDIKNALDEDVMLINDALNRALVDQKQICKVLNSMRIDWLRTINCATTDTLTGIGLDEAGILSVTENSTLRNFSEYITLFDDFHYDIGHGKGLGEGSVDFAPVTDGFRNGRDNRVYGDSQTQYGAPTVAWESPGRLAPHSRRGHF